MKPPTDPEILYTLAICNSYHLVILLQIIFTAATNPTALKLLRLLPFSSFLKAQTYKLLLPFVSPLLTEDNGHPKQAPHQTHHIRLRISLDPFLSNPPKSGYHAYLPNPIPQTRNPETPKPQTPKPQNPSTPKNKPETRNRKP